MTETIKTFDGRVVKKDPAIEKMISDYVSKAIEADRQYKEQLLKKKREEVEELKREVDEMIEAIGGYDKLKEQISKPSYYEVYFGYPCSNTRR